MMKFRIYENHIYEPRSEELNEGWSSPLFDSSLRGSHIWFSYINLKLFSVARIEISTNQVSLETELTCAVLSAP